MLNLKRLHVFLGLGLALPLIWVSPKHSQADANPVSSPSQCGVSETQAQAHPQERSTHPGSNYQAGQFYACQGEVKKAIEAYQEAIALDPQFAHAHLALGQLYAKQQDWEQAIAAYETVIKLDEKLGEVYPHLAQVYLQQDQPQTADRILKKALPLVITQSFDARYSDAGYLEAQSYLEQGQTLLSQGRLGQAEPLLRKATSLNPSNTDAALALSDVLVQRGQLDQAMNAVEQTYRYVIRRIGDDDSFVTSTAPFLSHSILSQYFIARGDLDTAIAVLKKMQVAIEEQYQDLPPSDSPDLDHELIRILRESLPIQIGALLVRQGQPDEALGQFRAAVYSSQFPLTASDLLELIASAATDPSKLEESSQNGTQTDQDVEAKAQRYLGDMYLVLDSIPQAIAAYQTGLQSAPKNLRLLSSLGFAQLKQEQIPEALTYYRKVVTLQRQAGEAVDSATINARATRYAVNELVRSKRFDDAIALLKTDLNAPLNPAEKLQHQIALSRIYRLTESHDLAIELLQQLVLEAPDERRVEIQSELAQLQMQQQQYAQAEETAQSMQSMGHVILGQVYGHQQKPKEAIASYLKGRQSSPSQLTPEQQVEREIQAHLTLALFLTRQENLEAAHVMYRHLSEVAQRANRMDSQALANFYIASLFVSQKQYDQALPILTTLLSPNQQPSAPFPFKEQAQVLLAKIYTQQGKYSQAIAASREAQGPIGAMSQMLGLSPNMSQDTLVYAGLAQELITLERSQLALDILNMTAQFHPKTSLPFQLRGQIYEKQGNWTQAIQDYKTAIAAVPDSFKSPSDLSLRFIHASLSDLYLRWGRILLHQDQSEAAQEKLEKAIQANEQNAEARELLQDAIARTKEQT